MAAETTIARESRVTPLNATGGARGRSKTLAGAGFTESNGTYERDLGAGVSISLRKYTTRDGETRYSSQVYNFDNARVGSYSESEVRKMARKMSGMSDSEARSAVDSYIRDLFNPRKTRTESDALKHRKKYLGF